MRGQETVAQLHVTGQSAQLLVVFAWVRLGDQDAWVIMQLPVEIKRYNKLVLS